MIDFDEFKVLMYKKMKNTDGAEDIKHIFESLDLYDQGYFTAQELHRVVLKLGENGFTLEEATELVNATATQERGKVNYEG